MAKKAETAWVAQWRGSDSGLLTTGDWLALTRRELMQAIRHDTGIQGAKEWKPVRVRITPIAAKKKGTVKRGK